MAISVEANWNNSDSVDYEANEKAQKEGIFLECLKEFCPLIICPLSVRESEISLENTGGPFVVTQKPLVQTGSK